MGVLDSKRRHEPADHAIAVPAAQARLHARDTLRIRWMQVAQRVKRFPNKPVQRRRGCRCAARLLRTGSEPSDTHLICTRREEFWLVYAYRAADAGGQAAASWP